MGTKELIAAARERAGTDSPAHALITELADALEAAEAGVIQAGVFGGAMMSSIRELSRNRGDDLTPHTMRALEILGKPIGAEARKVRA